MGGITSRMTNATQKNCSIEWLTWFTSKSSFIEALFDSIGSADVEGLCDLLVHETLSVQNVGHHHPKVEHLKQLRNGGHLHQIASTLVQAACVEVLKHCLEMQQTQRSNTLKT